ncbi:MAG TPA: DUF397 domain-containing protein [Acidimicrobiales bacterium]|jgi:hypothetical protein
MKHDHSAAQWRTSTFSDGLQCVEVAAVGDQVAVRHSKDPGGPVLHFTRGEMLAFLQGAKAGEFDDLA